MIEVTIFGSVALCAAAVIGAVMFAPEEPLDEPYWADQGDTDGDNTDPLAIESRPCPNPVHQPTPGPRNMWDEVDQHWGETQWMMVAG